jgi:hypothetical protein
MVEFDTIMLQFDQQGEKTGWTYIEIPFDIAEQLKPGVRTSFRVRGMLDSFPIKGIALMPMGEGNFIMALKADLRKGIRKNAGAMLHVCIEEDTGYKVEIPAELQECFDFEPQASDFFFSLPKSHREYFIKWINEAKTSETRSKRIVNTVNAMLRKWKFNEMLRNMKREG